jgi:hypothetical protein
MVPTIPASRRLPSWGRAALATARDGDAPSAELVSDLPERAAPAVGRRNCTPLTPSVKGSPRETVTISGQESDSTYLSVRTARRQVKWTLFSDDPADLHKAIETVLVGLRRKNQ